MVAVAGPVAGEQTVAVIQSPVANQAVGQDACGRLLRCGERDYPELTGAG